MSLWSAEGAQQCNGNSVPGTDIYQDRHISIWHIQTSMSILQRQDYACSRVKVKKVHHVQEVKKQ